MRLRLALMQSKNAFWSPNSLKIENGEEGESLEDRIHIASVSILEPVLLLLVLQFHQCEALLANNFVIFGLQVVQTIDFLIEQKFRVSCEIKCLFVIHLSKEKVAGALCNRDGLFSHDFDTSDCAQN